MLFNAGIKLCNFGILGHFSKLIMRFHCLIFFFHNYKLEFVNFSSILPIVVLSLVIAEDSIGFLFMVPSLLWACHIGFPHDYSLIPVSFAMGKELLKYLRSAMADCFRLARH